MKMILKFVASACVAAALVACGGGGGGSSIPVASQNATASFDAANGPRLIRALNNATLTFPNGVPALGTNTSTTMVITNANTASPQFSVTSGGNAASGSISFGSCIFRVTAVTSGTLFSVNQEITVNPCSITASIQGNAATGLPERDDLRVTLGSAVSNPFQAPLRITPTGSVFVINSDGSETLIATINVNFVTGTTGASS
jgi:hypothetical protein